MPSSEQTPSHGPDWLVRAIAAALEEESVKIAEEETEAAQKRIAERLVEARSRVVLNVMANYDVQRDGTNLIITVRNQDDKNLRR